MITLNLISPDKKKDLQLLRFYIVIKNSIILLLLFSIFVAIILLVAKLILQNNFNKVVAQTTLTTETRKIFNKEIREFNQELVVIENIQKDYTSWSKFLINLTETVPENIGIYSLTINEDKKDLEILGWAKTRNDLLAFEEKLKISPIVNEVEIPLANLLQKDNIDFEINIKFTQEGIK